MKMNRKTGESCAIWMVGGIGLLLLTGCGQNSNRKSLEGVVTLDGQPLMEGSIRLIPMQGTGGPTAGGEINDGKFSITSKGTFVGKFRVEITANRKTGQKKQGPFGNMVDDYEQYIPDRYNQQSKLEAEVTEAGPNHFEFPLSSQ